MNESQASQTAGSALQGSQAGTEETKVEMLLLHFSDHDFLLPLEQVTEINRPMPLTPIPLSPAYFLGLANLRGKPLCVIDPAVRMGLPAASEPVAISKQRFIGLRHPHMNVAIRVDAVEDIHSIRPGDVVQATAVGKATGLAEFILGSTDINGTIYDVLDWGALLC